MHDNEDANPHVEPIQYGLSQDSPQSCVEQGESLYTSGSTILPDFNGEPFEIETCRGAVQPITDYSPRKCRSGAGSDDSSETI